MVHLLMLRQFISRNLAALTLFTAAAAMFFPEPFLIFKDYFLWFFAATMFCLGLVMKFEEVKEPFSKPLTVLVGVGAQFSVMPLLGFTAAGIAVAFDVSPAIALGFIIVGCAPGAMASNVICYLLGGAVALSIAMTMLATTLSPIMTPVLVEALGGVYMEIPFLPMMQTILLIVVIPLVAGMIVHHFLPRFQKTYEMIAPEIAAIAIIIICSYAVAANKEMLDEIPLIIFLLVVALNAGGYLAGFLIGRICKFERRYQITLAIEIGMQNAGLGVALALKHFEPETALVGAIFAVWCILTAAGLSKLRRFRGKGRGDSIPAI